MNKKYSGLLMGILGIALLFSSLSANAQIQRYDKEATRARLLAMAVDTRLPQIKLQGKYKSPQEKAFVEFWLTEIVPVELSYTPHVRSYIAHKLLSDSGSYNDDAEKNAWMAKMTEAQAFFNKLQTSQKWTRTLKKWAHLAKGLEGELPQEALRTYRDRVMYAFAPAYTPKLNEVDKLENDFEAVAHQAPAAADLRRAATENADATRLFKAGEMSYDEASNIITTNYKNAGERFVGFQAQEQLPDNLNRMAVLRSELALSKGFKTWAEFQLSGDEGYSKIYRGVDAQREFLTGIIKTLSGPVKQIVDDRIKILGLTADQVKGEHLGLVLPQSLGHVRLYFPASELTKIWLTSMLESGFSAETLGQIMVDDEQRPNKMATGAYNMTATAPYLDVNVFNLESLSFSTPRRDSPKWNKGFTYILQSYKTGGIGDLTTMFHEGGHALERTAKFKNKEAPESYAYVETPSTTMELFLNDPEVLFDKAVPIDGQKPSVEEFTRLINNTKQINAFGLLSSATISLFDVDLWDYDYSAPGAKTFMQRVEELSDEGDRLMQLPERSPSAVPGYYGNISTSHFISGAVRNPGYVFAEMSSIMMGDFILDQMEKDSGRRSWLKQPTLAALLNDRFFSQGWRRPFPENIESITGRKYNPAKIIDAMLKDAGIEATCSTVLKR